MDGDQIIIMVGGLAMRCRTAALGCAFLIAIAGCGGDSSSPTAPKVLTSQDALQSLTHGLSSLAQTAAPSGTQLPVAMLSPIATSQTMQVSQISVGLDGSPVQMFGLAQRVIYPPNSCLEQLFALVGFADPSSCTAPPGALLLILWQTGSATQAPDRIVVVSADTGVVTFADQSLTDSSFSGDAFSISALYWEPNGTMWGSSGGSLASVVTQGGETCTAFLPLFAKSAVCDTGTFTESGNLSFAPIVIGTQAATGTHTVALSAQVIHGIIQTVTATAPFVIPPN